MGHEAENTTLGDHTNPLCHIGEGEGKVRDVKVSPQTAPNGPTSRARLLRVVGTVAAMLVMGLSASTAVALADDGRQGDPSRSAPTTLVDAMVTTTDTPAATPEECVVLLEAASRIGRLAHTDRKDTP